MKKILAMLLAVMMLLSVASVAMADEINTDQQTVTIKKVYKLANAGTKSPAETFNLTQTGSRVVDGEATSAPDLGTITGATFAEGAATVNGATGDITVTLPEYTHVGVYEYTLKETAATTAGVTYFGNNIKLVVTVVNGENGKLRIAAVHTEADGADKSDTFVNTYSAGKLNVTKTVTGNLGDKDKYFTVTVTLTGENGKTYADSYAVTGGKYTAGETIKVGEPKTFELKNGDTISIANLPYGVTYTVVEGDYTGDKGGYERPSYTGDVDDDAKIDGATQNVTITNNKGGTIDTGVMLDSMPYVLVLAVVGAAVIALIAKKRRAED